MAAVVTSDHVNGQTHAFTGAAPAAPTVGEQLGGVLSPSQVSTFLNCSAQWMFRKVLRLPEPKTGALAIGSALHKALQLNFAQKIETKEDLPTVGAVALYRVAWDEAKKEAVFRDDEDPGELSKMGEILVRKFMDDAAPSIDPAAVELPVSGAIAGVKVHGYVDLLDTEGRIIDVKSASKKPSAIEPDYAFQIATYRRITPGANGGATLATLTKTKNPQLVHQAYTVSPEDLAATEKLYPLVQSGIRNGLYLPNRASTRCSRKYCAFWRACEREFGGKVRGGEE